MVFAVQCPNPKCRKYMLVEDEDRGKVVSCLICRTPIRAGGGAPAQAPSDASEQRGAGGQESEGQG